jgi:SAM-dependent methyltransferase
MKLSDAWEAEADNWVAWARKPGHDSYWQFHRDRFLQLLPPPAGLTLDVGCGEGRLPRDLKKRGYQVVGVDASSTLIAYAREADPDGDYRVADAASLPLSDESITLVTAFLSLHDIEDMPGAIAEAARALKRGGRIFMAIVHPINSAGKFESRAPDAAFVIRGSYLEPGPYVDVVERDGMRMTFTSEHRPIQSYADASTDSGLLIERLVEVPDETDPPGERWQRLPLFLHLRVVKP